MSEQTTPLCQHVMMLGCGNMGFALLRGWVAQKIAKHFTVITIAPSSELVEFAANHKIALWEPDKIDAQKIDAEIQATGLPTPDVAVLAVKPHQIDDVLGEYQQKTTLLSQVRLLVSVAAGVELARLQKSLPTNCMPARLMPNLSVSVSQSVSGIITVTECPEAQKNVLAGMASSVGQYLWLKNEEAMHDFTAICGSGPAFCFYFAEAMEALAADKGFTAEQARIMAVDTLRGAATLLSQLSSQQSIGSIRRQVTSPNGTTQAGLTALMGNQYIADDLASTTLPQEGLIPLLQKTLEQASQRSKKLSCD